MDSETLVNTAMLIFLIGCQLRHERQLARIEATLKNLIGGES